MTIINEMSLVIQRYIRAGMTPKAAHAKAVAELFRQAEQEYTAGEEAIRDYVEQVTPPARLTIARRSDGLWLQRGDRPGLLISGHECASLIDQRRRDNPEPHRARHRRYYHRRRARIDNPGHILQAEWDEMIARYGGRCVSCGATEDICMDHIVPLSKGGANTIDNVQPLCRSCNAKKWTRSTDYRPDKKAA